MTILAIRLILCFWRVSCRGSVRVCLTSFVRTHAQQMLVPMYLGPLYPHSFECAFSSLQAVTKAVSCQHSTAQPQHLTSFFCSRSCFSSSLYLLSFSQTKEVNESDSFSHAAPSHTPSAKRQPEANMSTASRETRRRQPQTGLRTHTVNGITRDSPTWRQRSRSYSHEHVLYRMGCRKNAQGEWDAVDNLPTAGLAAAMRAMRLKSEVRIKREPSTEIDVDQREGSVDMTDPVEVLEEIRVYIDVDEWVATNMNGDEEEETVMQSVETKLDFESDMETKFGVSGDASGGFELFQGETRDSLASVPEEREGDEDQMDVDQGAGNHQQPNRIDDPGDVPPPDGTRRVASRRKKWTDPEIHYVLVLTDAGYTVSQIAELFQTKFPHAAEVAKSSITYCRSRYVCIYEYVKYSRLLAIQLGFRISSRSILSGRLLLGLRKEERSERNAVMEQHRQEMDQGNAAPEASSEQLETKSLWNTKMHTLFVAQRTQWRELLSHEMRRQDELRVSLDTSLLLPADVADYVTFLTVLVHQSRERSQRADHMTKYFLPNALQQELKQSLLRRDWWKSNYSDILQNRWCSAEIRLIYEYDMACLLFVQDHNVFDLFPIPVEVQGKARDLLGYDKESLKILEKRH